MEVRDPITDQERIADSLVGRKLPKPKRPNAPCEPACDAQLDDLLDERDRLRGVLDRLETYNGNVPTEIIAQQAALSEVRSELRKFGVMRGDYPDEDPRLKAEKDETPDERAIRVLARILELQANGVRGFRIAVAREEGCSVSTIRKLIDRAKRLEAASAPQRRNVRRT